MKIIDKEIILHLEKMFTPFKLELEKFLSDTAPAGKWTKHDEPGTPFRKNFHEHIRTKLIGSVSMTFIVKDGELYIGKYQDIYFYSPLYKDKPDQKVLCRIIKFD